MEEVKLRENASIVLVQVGPLRLIGQMEEPQVSEGDRHRFLLLDYGVVQIMRGQRPGPIQGTMQEVKLISIATLDFAKGPIAATWINDYSFLVRHTDLDGDGAEDMKKMYLGFLSRKPSMVEHVRAAGELP